MTKNRTKEALLTLALIAAMAATGTAQKKTQAQKPTKTTLAQAVVVEIYEHNLGKAMDMYRTIADDTKRTEDTRTRARLRLAKAYRRLGQNTEAEATLSKAAAGKGPAAKEAASILSGQARDDGDLVKAKVEQALLAMRLTGKPDRSDLTWIGRAAVPYIVKAVKAEKADLRFITNASRVLFQLGGPKVLNWMEETRKSTDVLRKRAVIKGFDTGDKEVKAKMAVFLTDKDVTVRREVVTNGSRFLSADGIFAALDDPDEVVREKAMSIVRLSWRSIEHDGTEFELFVRLMPKLEQEETDFGSWTGSPWTMASWLAGHQMVRGAASVRQIGPASVESFPATKEGRTTLLRAVAFRCFRNCSLRWPKLDGKPKGTNFSSEIAAAARKVRDVNKDGAQQPNPFANVRTLSEALRDTIRFWGRADISAVLALVEFGYDSNGTLGRWVAEHGKAEDLPAVADKLQFFDERRGVEQVCNWMTKVGPPRDILGTLEALVAKFESDPRSSKSRLRAVLNTILSIGSKESTDFLIGKIVEDPGKYMGVIRARPDDARERAVLRELLVIPGEDENSAGLRQMAFRQLLKSHSDPGDPARFARAYEIGFQKTGPCMDIQKVGTSPRPRGVFFTYNGSNNWPVRCTVQNRAKILAACLATGEVEAFKDLADAIRWGTSTIIGDVVCRNLKHCPKLETAQGKDARSQLFRRALGNLAKGEAGTQLAIDALTHASPAVRRVGMQNLQSRIPASEALTKQVMHRLEDKDAVVRRNAAYYLANTNAHGEGLASAMAARLKDSDSYTVANAIDFLRKRDADTLTRRADELLGHAHQYVRYQAAVALIDRNGAKQVAKIGPLLADEALTKDQKTFLITRLGGLMDLKVVPYLIQALKSPELRKAAQQQLQAIRFYHEESSKWDRVMKGAGFTQATAAQALIGQAKAGKQAIRLAAIASLGTLGEAETLPFLVGLIGDENAEIAAAAQDAVNRINKAGKK